MPSDCSTDDGQTLGETEAEDLLRGICFKTGPPRKVGWSLEWLVHDLRDPERPVPTGRLEAAFRACGSCLWSRH